MAYRLCLGEPSYERRSCYICFKVNFREIDFVQTERLQALFHASIRSVFSTEENVSIV